MEYSSYSIQVEGSDKDARLLLYIQSYYPEMRIDKRPLVLICPGGGYSYTSVREGEPLAMQFMAMGYHAAVLKYSCSPAKFPTALEELAKAVATIRDMADDLHIKKDAIIVLGCSAGGHLAASLGTMWHEKFLSEDLELDNETFRPNGMILCYPVIHSGEYAHRGSFECLLGQEEGKLERYADHDSLLYRMSLEHRVTDKTPPTFIWHTFTDGSVPVENSLYFVSAMRKAGVPTEFHLYPQGGHGLALANYLTQCSDGSAVQEECTSWTGLVKTWVDKNYGQND